MGKVDAERVARANRIVSDAPPIEKDALDVQLQRWGLPPTAPLAFLCSPSEVLSRPAHGFRAETVFTPCDSFKARQCPWQYLRLPTIGDGEVVVTHIRGIPWPDDDAYMLLMEVRFRIWKPGTPTFAEMRLDPDTLDTHMDVRDLDERAACAPKSLSHLLDAASDHAYNKPGPKEGDISLPDFEDFIERCVRGINRIVARECALPRDAKTRLAQEELGMNPKTLTNHLIVHARLHTELPIQWRAFLAYLRTRDQYDGNW
jgi:hypothetical protein